jgi:hypothetical protein
MTAPVLAVGDGALGFWKALREVFRDARQQRCWFPVSSNVLAALPKSAHPGAKAALGEIYNAEDKTHALEAVKPFEADYSAKWPKAVAKITEHMDVLLAFYDYPAQHWIHLRTTNSIESTQRRPQLVGGFATAPDRVLLRTGQNRDPLGEFAVSGQRTVHVGIHAQDIRQCHRISVIGFCASNRGPIPIAGHGNRVDREHRPPTGTQDRDQQATRGFDRDCDRVLGAVAGLSEHPSQSGEPGRVIADTSWPPASHHCPRLQRRDALQPSRFRSSSSIQHLHQFGCSTGPDPLTRTRSTLLTSLSGLPPMSCSRSQRTRTTPVFVRARWL